MLKIAITGNIGAGKSEAEKIIKSLGFPVFDTDEINNNILLTNEPAINQVKELFNNNNILNNKHKIDKNLLGKIVFSDEEKKKSLENILHSYILKELEEIFNNYEKEKAVFISIPLLFEAGWQDKFDKIILICADKDLRLKRLIKRNNYTEEYARMRIQAQEDEENKIKKSDYIIYNNTDFSDLKIQVIDILNKIFKD